MILIDIKINAKVMKYRRANTQFNRSKKVTRKSGRKTGR